MAKCYCGMTDLDDDDSEEDLGSLTFERRFADGTVVTDVHTAEACVTGQMQLPAEGSDETGEAR